MATGVGGVVMVVGYMVGSIRKIVDRDTASMEVKGRGQATESLGIVLTSQSLNGPENYLSWARSVFLALSSQNKFGFVNGLIPQPDPTSPLYNSWSRCNTTMFSWLTNSLSLDLKASVMYISTARDLWIDLRDRLSQGNTPRQFELQKEIAHLSQGSLTASQLEAQHKEHVFHFLMGLNDSYGNIIGQILLLEPFPSISKVCSLISQEEKRRSFGHGVNVVYPTEATAMFVTHAKGFNGNQGQNQGTSGNKGHSKKDRPICTYCGLSGHIANKCYKLHGYPLGYKHKGSNQAMANHISAIFPSGNFGNPSFGVALTSPQASVQGSLPQCPISQVQCEQLLNYLKIVTAANSGIGTSIVHQVATVMASAPIIQSALTPTSASSATDLSNFSVSQLTAITSTIHTYVYLPNGDQALVTHIGIVQISPTLTLTNDLAQWSMIGLGKECPRLYLLQAPASQPTPIALVASTSHSSSTLWNNRLGHPSFSKFSLLNKLVDSEVFNKSDCCENKSDTQFFIPNFVHTQLRASVKTIKSDNAHPSTSYLDSFVFPHCVSDASFVSDHPASSLFDSTLASSQLDSTIPTPILPSIPLPSQSNSQPAASLEPVLSNEP
ncbi:uncharacterized protein LOC142632900 [Castanea sativa]|uniref:uncharacterized protein LOC142632900 n=1 Tax=Castanea sativa TaxID=21020 RepID=UPI003F64D6B9